MPELESGSTKLKIKNVQNPTSNENKGTGNFQIFTYSKGDILEDSNENFGILGTAPAPNIFSLTSSCPTGTNSKGKIENDGSNMGGFLTNYVLSFENTVTIAENSWFRLEFPTEYIKFGSVSCTLVNLNLQLNCEIKNKRILYITGLNQQLNPSGSNWQRIKLRNIYNPFKNSCTQDYIFESLKSGTNTVIEQYKLAGIQIEPGIINNPTIKGNPQNKDLFIDYTITFTPMNTIEQGGKIEVEFPPQFGKLDSTCRVIIGLIPISNSVSCTSAGKILTITNFQTFTPQYIELKIKATNPSTTALTDHFQIRTFKKIGSTFYIVDENKQCGQLQMAAVEKPYFLQIDLYKKMVNMSLNQFGPVDFRLYPHDPYTLPSTQSSRIGDIYFQIPLWWTNKDTKNGLDTSGQNPQCEFGPTPSASCKFGEANRIQVYQIKTPSTGDSNRYSTSLGSDPVGLGECDLPISVRDVQMPPIPGRFDFRVLTFIDKDYMNSGWTSIPAEQDFFTMDIPVTNFGTNPTIYTTSAEQLDIDNILRIEFSVGIQIPWEGAINMNFTVRDNLFENSAGWPEDLGFGKSYTDSPNYKIIDCRVQIGSSIVGYPGSPHPDIRCFVFGGKLAATIEQDRFALLQVRGFSGNIASGTSIQIDIPHVKLCGTINMYCYVMLTTAYTIGLDNPYTLNYYKKSIAFIKGPSAKTSGSNSFKPTRSSQEICAKTTWTFQLNLATKLSIGDHIVLKFPSKPFRFDRSGIGSNIGRVDIIVVNIRVPDTLYYVIKLTTDLNSGAPTSFTLTNVLNSNWIDPFDSDLHFPTAPFLGIDIQMMYWRNLANIEYFTFPNTDPWQDGGINQATITRIPAIRSMDYESWIIHKIEFRVCNKIPKEGAITIQVPFSETMTTYFQEATIDCTVFSGISGTPYKLGSLLHCKRDLNQDYYLIKNFLEIPMLSTISVVFSFKTKVAGSTYSPTQYKVTTWLDSTKSFISHSTNPLIKNEIDFMQSGNMPTPFQIDGPKSFPTFVQFEEFWSPKIKARENSRGSFYMHIKTTGTVPSFNTDPSSKIVVRFPSELTTGPSVGVLECRIKGYLSEDCTGSTVNIGGNGFYEINIKMPKTISINGGTKSLISIDTRGEDYSGTWHEGLLWRKAGLFEIQIEAHWGGTKKEYTKKIWEVYARAFDEFWVHSGSKMRHTTNAAAKIADIDRECSNDLSINKNCGFNYFRIFAKFPTSFPAYDNAEQPKMWLEFHRTNQYPLFFTGFTHDLGTGILHRGQIPCTIFNINPLTDKEIICKIFHGTWPNPTQIFIENFDSINTQSSIKIVIPGIFNPNKSMELMKVSLRASKIISGKQTPFLDGEYDLINMTQQIQASSTNQLVNQITVTLGDNPGLTFANTDTNTDTTFSIKYKSQTHPLGPSDQVLFQFPKYWQPKINLCQTTHSNMNPNCEAYPQPSQIMIQVQSGKITENSWQSGTLRMFTPPFKYVQFTGYRKIRAFVFARSWLTDILTYPIFQQNLIEKTIPQNDFSVICGLESDNNDCIYDEIKQYTFQIQITNTQYEVPKNGVLEIEIHNQYTLISSTCSNDKVGGSDLDDLGFSCNADGQKYIIKIGDSGLKNGKKARIKFSLKNPVSPNSCQDFKFSTYYEYETPLNKRIASQWNVLCLPKAVLKASTVSTDFWNTQFKNQNMLHIGDTGPITLYIEFPIQINKGITASNYVDFYFKINQATTDSFQMSISKQLISYWDENPAYQTILSSSPDKIRMFPPQFVDITAGKTWRITLTSINSLNGDNGFVYPTNPGSYQIEAQFFNGGSLICKQNLNIVVPGQKFTNFEVKSIIKNIGMKTVLDIVFLPQDSCNSYATGGRWYIKIPTKTKTGVLVYENDAGTGLQTNQNIECIDVLNNLGTLDCTIKALGNQGNGKPFEIEVKNYNALSAQKYHLRIGHIKNPAVASDLSHAIYEMQILNGATIRNHGFYYDSTFTKFTISTENLPAPFSNPNSQEAGYTGQPFGTKIKSNFIMKSQNNNDFFIIEFPKPVFPSQPYNLNCPTSPVNADCYIIQSHNWVVAKVKSDLAANLEKNFELTGCSQAKYNVESGIQMFAYAISRRIARIKYNYGSYNIKTGTAAPSSFTVVTPDVTQTVQPKNKQVKYLITLITPNAGGAVQIDTGSVIDLIFPTGYGLSPTCENEFTSALQAQSQGSLKCISSSQIYTLSGFADILPGTEIKLQAWITNPNVASTGKKLLMQIFQDSAKANKIYEFETNLPDINSHTGFKIAQMGNYPSLTPFIIRKSDTGEFSFQLKYGQSISSQGYAKVIFPSSLSVTVPTGANLQCLWDSYQAAACTYQISAGELSVFIYPPNSPSLIVGNRYDMLISSTCGSSQYENGLIFGNSGTKKINIELYSDASTKIGNFNSIFHILKTDFTSAKALWLWNNKNTQVPIIFEFQPQQIVPTDGSIEIWLPYYQSQDTSKSMFEKNLGISEILNSGDEIKNCFGVKDILPISGKIICKAYIDDKFYAKIIINGFQAIAINKIPQIMIEGIKNPNNGNDNGYIDILLLTKDNLGNIINDKVLMDVGSPQVDSSPSLQSLTLNPSSTIIGQGGITYDFTNIQVDPNKLTPNGRIIFQFPSSYDLPNSVTASSGVVLGTYKHIVVWKPSSTVTGSTVSVSLEQIKNSYGAETKNIFVYVVYHRIYEKYFQSSITYTSLPSSDLSFTYKISNTHTETQATTSTITYFITILKNIPANGFLEIEWSFSCTIKRAIIYQGLDKGSSMIINPSNKVTFQLSKEYKTTDPQIKVSLSIQYGTSAASGTHKMIAKATSTSIIVTSATQAISITAYPLQPNSNTAGNCIIELNPNNAYGSFNQLKIIHKQRVGNTFANSGQGSIQIFGSHGIDFSSSTATINGNSIASLTKTSSNTNNFITGQSTGSLASTNTIIINGLSYNSNFSPFIDITFKIWDTGDNEICHISNLEFASGSLTSGNLIIGHLQSNEMNFLEIQFQLPSSLTEDAYRGFYLEFVGFSNDMGTGLPDNSRIPCQSAQFANLVAILRHSNANLAYPRIYFSKFNLIDTSSKNIIISRFTNPTLSSMINLVFYDIQNGNHEKSLYSKTLFFEFNSAAVSSETQSVSTSSTGFQALSTAGLSLQLTTPINNLFKFVYFILGSNAPSMQTYATNTISVTQAQSCVSYTKAKMILCQSKNAADSQVQGTLSNYENPGVQTSSTGIILQIIDPNSQITKKKIFQTSNSLNTITGLSIKSLDSPNNFMTPFEISMNLPINIPNRGCLKITLTGFSATAASSLQISTSTHQGNIQAEIQTGNLFLHNFDYISAGILTFTININGATYSSTQSIIFETFIKYVSGTASLKTSSGTSNLIYSANSPISTIFYFPWLRANRPIFASQSGFLTFRFLPSSQMTSSQWLKLKKLDGFTYTTNKKLVCIYSEIGFPFQNSQTILNRFTAQYCIFNDAGDTIIISSPKSALITNSDTILWELQIHYHEESDPFIGFPASGNYQFQISLDSTEQTFTFLEAFTDYLKVPKQGSPSCLRSFNDKTGDDNTLFLQFKSISGVPSFSAGGRVLLKLPTTSLYKGVKRNLYASNIGLSTINSGQPLPCVIIGVTGIGGQPVQCYLHYGIDGNIEQTIGISLYNFVNIGVGSTIKITIQRHLNPSTDNMLTDAILETYSNTDRGDYQYFQVASYTSSSPTTTITTNFNVPSFNPDLSVDNTINFNLITYGGTTFSNYDGILFDFGKDFYKDTTISATETSGLSVSVHIQQQGKAYFTFDHIYPFISKVGSVTFQISNMKNGPNQNTPVNWKVYIMKNRMKLFLSNYNQNPPVFTLASFDLPIIQSVKLEDTKTENPVEIPLNSLTNFIWEFTTKVSIPAGGCLELIFPSQFSSYGTSCQISGGYFDIYICTQSSNSFFIKPQKEIPSGTTLIISEVKAQTPNSIGLTDYLGIKGYTDSSCTQLKAQNLLVHKLKIVNRKAFVKFYIESQKESRKQIQALDYGPLNFRWILTQTFNTNTQFIEIKFNSGTMWKTGLDGFLKQQISSVDYDDLICFWGQYAAFDCEPSTNGIKVYAPSQQVVTSGSEYDIFVGLNHYWMHGLINNNYRYPEANDYQLNVESSVKILRVPGPSLKQFFSVSFSATKSEFTLLYFQFVLKENINKATDANKGQIIIELQTLNDNGERVFENDMGSGKSNGAEWDCICSTGCANEQDAKCKIQLGSNNKDSPASFLIEPQQIFAKDNIYVIKIPKIKNSVTNSVIIGQFRLFGRNYDTSTNKWSIIGDSLLQDGYYTTTFTKNQQTVVFKPQFTSTGTQNLVGKPETISFTWLNNAPQINPNTYDRFILYTEHTGMLFQKVASTNVVNGQMTLFPINNWIEIIPTANFAGTSTITVQFNDFVNQNYQFPTTNKLIFEIFTWETLDIREKTIFAATDPANPNILTFKSFSPDCTPPNQAVIQQPQYFDLQFTGYNRIPKDGLIEIQIPNCADCNWEFPDTYCTVSTGLFDAACDIIPTTKTIIIKSFTKDYIPKTDGKITVKYLAQNPSKISAPGASRFIVTTFWSQSQKEKIDQDLQFDIPQFQLQAPQIIEATLYDTYMKQKPICGSILGPITLTFQLKSGVLNYKDDHYLLIHFSDDGFIIPGNFQELICYWSDPADFKIQKVKSYRCEFTGKNLQVYIPEELVQIDSTKKWQITILTRFNGGLQANSPPKKYWVKFEPMGTGTNDIAWIEANVPACPFDCNQKNGEAGPQFYHQMPDQKEFYVWSINHESSKTLSTDVSTNDPTWNVISFRLQTGNTLIPSGDLNNPNQHSRFIFEFFTHNELKQNFDKDLGYGPSLVSNTQAEVGCGSYYFGTSQQVQPANGKNYIECYVVQADGVLSNSTPAYVLMYNHEQINANTKFNLQISKLGQPIYTGAQSFSHMIIRVESKQEDGSYYNIYKHPVFHLVKSYLQPPLGGIGWKAAKTTSSGSVSFYQQEKRVTTLMGDITWQVNSATVINLGDSQLWEYTEPYDDELPNSMQCIQYIKSEGQINSNVGGHCGVQKRTSFITLHNVYRPSDYTSNSFTSFKVRNKLNNWKNPDYEWQTLAGADYSDYYMYFFKNFQMVQMTTGKQSPTKGFIYVVLQTPSATNPINMNLKYKMGIYITSGTIALHYLRMTTPKNDAMSFPIIQPKCQINRGFVLKDINNPTDEIACTITTSGTDYLLEIYNFGNYKGDNWMIIDLDVKNPAQQGWTPQWMATTYNDRSTYSTTPPKIMDQCLNAGGRTWIGKRPQSNLFRIYRNTISFENRRAQKNEYAEVHMRLLTKTTLPATKDSNSARVEIWMPNTYDIPNGGTKVCDMGHKDHIPYDNIHKDLQGQYCTITSDRKIKINTDSDVGLPGGSSGYCSLGSITTSGAIGGDGVKLPETPGGSDFEVYEYIGENLIEYSKPTVTAKPEPLGGSYPFSIKSTITEHDIPTVVRINFKTMIYIPAGYDTSVNIADVTQKNPIGYIIFKFNSIDKFVGGYQGFQWTLNTETTGTYQYKMPCKPIKNLIPKDGEKIKCMVSKANSDSIYDPAIITVSNFKAIAPETEIEIHMIDVGNLRDWQNDGNVIIAAKQVLAGGTGSHIWIILDSKGYIPCTQKQNIPWLKVGSGLDRPGSLVINPSTNFVGEYLIMDFTFPLDIDLNSQDNIVLYFESMFELQYQSENTIQATLDGKLLKTIIYAEDQKNMIYFEIPSTISPGSSRTLRVSQIRNAAYAWTGTHQILMKILRATKVKHNYNFPTIPAAVVAPFTSRVMVLSSYLQQNVFVTYTFSVTPSYRIPKGSKLTINLPDYTSGIYNGLSYSHLASSNPAATCLVTPVSTFTTNSCIQANKLEITADIDINEGTSIQIVINGAKNPNFVGESPEDAFVAIITDLNNREINKNNFGKITFLPKKKEDVLFMTITPSNLYRKVNCDTKFTIQNTNQVPPGGGIYLQFPPIWGDIIPAGYKITSLKGSFSDLTLTFTESYNSVTKTLKIVNQFTWPSQTSLYIQLDKLKNPDISQTGIFKAWTIYDSLKLDKTDENDVSLKLSFLAYSPGMTITSTKFSPTNEGELSNYELEIKTNKEIPAGSQMEFIYPSSYDQILTTYDKQLTCTMPPSTIEIKCYAENKKLILPISSKITSGSSFKLKIEGIMNPNSNTNPNTIDILTKKGTDILDYTNSAATYSVSSAPQVMDMTKITTTSTSLQAKADYTFCIQTSKQIPLNSEVLIDFPEQFQILQTEQACSTATGHNAISYSNTVTSPLCKISNNIRRISISGHTTAYDGTAGLKSLCYTLKNIDNPATSGESGNFVVSIFDKDNSQILYKTYGTLSYPTSLSYSRQGLRIIVSSIPDIPVLTMSNKIAVKLERSVPYTVTLVPSTIDKDFEFIPSTIQFLSYLGSTQYFNIRPLSNAKVGKNKISWIKTEADGNSRFSEVPDTFFNLIQQPNYNQLKLTVGATISRTALGATSLPIKATLSNPAAQILTLFYKTESPSQPDYIIFEPNPLIFNPGETIKSFTYSTKPGAVSGKISFWLDSDYQNKYVMPVKSLSFEILDIDTTKPELLNYYIVSLDRTYMDFRISSSESVWIYYLLTLKGTIKPPEDEIFDPALRVKRKTKTDVQELNGKNSSYQAPVTNSYIYYDTFLHFVGLEEETNYVLYFIIRDLSGNQLGTQAFHFKTLRKHQPCKFNLVLKKDVSTSNIIKAFGLITGLQQQRYFVNNAPKKFSVQGSIEPKIQQIIEKGTTTYTFTLLQNKTANEQRPIKFIEQLENQKNILLSEITDLDSTYNLNTYAYEIIDFEQEFSYKPYFVGVTEDTASFNISIKRNGTIFGIVMEKGSPIPNGRQMKNGLSSTNFKLNTKHYISQRMEYPEDSQSNKIYSKLVKFSDLYDNTQYEAYFIAQNDLPINPDLMEDINIQKAEFTTIREIFVLGPDYIQGYRLICNILILCLTNIIIFLIFY